MPSGGSRDDGFLPHPITKRLSIRAQRIKENVRMRFIKIWLLLFI